MAQRPVDKETGIMQPRAQVAGLDKQYKNLDLASYFSVAGKVVLVTGGGGGIGRGIAAAFVGGGAKVYIASRNDLTAIAAELSEAGAGSCAALKADLSKQEDIDALAKTIADQNDGKLDVLVNNSGLSEVRRFEKFTMEGFDKVIGVNLRAPFFLAKACMEMLTKAGSAGSHAAVVNIASVDGIRIPQDNDWAYGPGKAGLIQMTRIMASRFGNTSKGGAFIGGATGGANKATTGGRNITFNVVAPGPFPGMLDVVLQTDEQRAGVGGVTMVGRVGEPMEDCGLACVYLASKAGSFITGATLPVDGGLLVGKAANM